MPWTKRWSNGPRLESLLEGPPYPDEISYCATIGVLAKWSFWMSFWMRMWDNCPWAQNLRCVCCCDRMGEGKDDLWVAHLLPPRTSILKLRKREEKTATTTTKGFEPLKAKKCWAFLHLCHCLQYWSILFERFGCHSTASSCSMSRTPKKRMQDIIRDRENSWMMKDDGSLNAWLLHIIMQIQSYAIMCVYTYITYTQYIIHYIYYIV